MGELPGTPVVDVHPEGDTPVVGRGGPPVAAVVHACHERAIDEALARLAVPGLTRDTLEPVLAYCAELRCETDGVTCPRCKRRTEAAGIASLDDFIRRHAEIVIGDGAVRLTGSGTGVAHAPSLEELAKTWSGENYWFWARRVIRKLRHGVRRAHIAGEAVAGEGDAGRHPHGAATRRQHRHGGARLRQLRHRRAAADRAARRPNEKARIAASGANYVIDDAVTFPSLDSAIADLNWVGATTARQRDLRKPVLTPEQAAAEMRARIARGERCGLLFGRERSGLETAEVANADALVMIPVNNRFASLNLAQSVLIMSYEWMKSSPAASLGRVTTYERPLQPGLHLGEDRPATKYELVGFFEHLESELERLGFFNPSHKRPTVVQNLRSMFTRMGATEQEVRTLRGIVATLARARDTAASRPHELP